MVTIGWSGLCLNMLFVVVGFDIWFEIWSLRSQDFGVSFDSRFEIWLEYLNLQWRRLEILEWDLIFEICPSLNWRLFSLRINQHRRLADGSVHCAGSATYQIWFRLPFPNPNPNPNSITDPNPNRNRNPDLKITKKWKRHQNEIEHRVISKSRFRREGGGFKRGL